MKGTLHIIGGGAIGSLLAAGAKRHCIECFRYPRNIDLAPTKVHWLDGNEIDLSPVSDAPTILQAEDVLVLPLKVYQLHSALRTWRPFLTHQPTVVLLHNGMGGLEIARDVLPENYPLLLAITSHGALTQSDVRGNKVVRYTGGGTTKIGSPTKNSTHQTRLKNAIALLNEVLPPVEYQQDIWQALWLKLAINAVINPITALHNIKNSQVGAPEFEEIRRALSSEFVQVANACGQNFNEAVIQHEVLKVAKATGENYSSMHQDVMHGRATEIEAINGYIVQIAKKKGIHVPVNTLLVERVKALRS